MADSDYLKCSCQKCGDHIEFPATELGAMAACPHCGAQTALIIAAPRTNRAVPKTKSPSTVALFFGALVSVLAAGIVIGIICLGKKKSDEISVSGPSGSAAEVATQAPATAVAADTKLDFVVSKISLQKTEGSGLVYAVGTLKNVLRRQRFGVTVELNLLNDQDQNIGVASDYTPVIEPGKEWKFKALLAQPDAVKVTVSGIKEQ